MFCLRLIVFGVVLVVLNACGDDAAEQPVAHKPSNETAQATQEQPDKTSGVPQATSAGGVSVQILPGHPTSEGCLRAVLQGNPGRRAIVWSVNGNIVKSGTEPRLCDDQFSRGDLVTVTVGTTDQGAQTSVSIGNSPPRVVDISSTPAEIYSGINVTVTPVAEDHDGDEVDFFYQWLINGEPNSSLTEATLPGNMFKKGDTIQVQIVPNDFFEDGPVYESYAMPIPNAAPQITSQPPQEITSLDYEYQVVAFDPDDSTFTYRLDEAPGGMTIDENTGLIKWSLVEATPGDHTIAVIVADPDGAESAQEYTLTLTPAQ